MLAALAAGAVFGLAIGLAIGWNGAKYPENASFLIAVFTAVGTVGAALAAVLVPLRQNRERREEQEYNRLTQEWVVADSMYRVLCGLRDLVNEYKKSRNPPLLTDVSHYIRQLELADQAYLSPIGRIVIAGGLDLALKLSRHASPQPKKERAASQGEAYANAFKRIVEIEALKTTADGLVDSNMSWQDQILVMYDPFGKRPAFVIRGRG